MEFDFVVKVQIEKQRETSLKNYKTEIKSCPALRMLELGPLDQESSGPVTRSIAITMAGPSSNFAWL